MSKLCKAEGGCTAVELNCNSIIEKRGPALSRPVSSQGERRVFPSDQICTSRVGVNFTGSWAEAKVVDQVEAGAGGRGVYSYYHCFILKRTALPPPHPITPVFFWSQLTVRLCTNCNPLPPGSAALSLASQSLRHGPGWKINYDKVWTDGLGAKISYPEGLQERRLNSKTPRLGAVSSEMEYCKLYGWTIVMMGI